MRRPLMARTRHKQRRSLCRDQIVEAAVRFVDLHGFDALSMRTLAKDLGIEAMSLYSHLASKDELLSGVVQRVLDDLEIPQRDVDPLERVRIIARRFRSIGHKHPNIFPLIILRPQRLNAALVPVEATLDALVSHGLSPDDASRAQRVLLGFVRGYTMWEIGGFVTGRRSNPGSRPRASVLAELRALDEDRFPRIRELAPHLLRYDPDEEFERGLDTVLRGICALRHEAKRAARKPARSTRAPR